MSREPSLGPLGRPATASTGIQRGGRPLAAGRGNPQPGAAQHPPTGNQAGTTAVQAGMAATPANLRNGAAGDAAAPTTAGQPDGRVADAPQSLRPSLDGGV